MVEDLVAYKVLRESVSVENFNHINEWVIMRKILVTSHQKTEIKRPNHWLEHIAQNRFVNGQQ